MITLVVSAVYEQRHRPAVRRESCYVRAVTRTPICITLQSRRRRFVVLCLPFAILVSSKLDGATDALRSATGAPTKLKLLIFTHLLENRITMRTRKTKNTTTINVFFVIRFAIYRRPLGQVFFFSASFFFFIIIFTFRLNLYSYYTNISIGGFTADSPRPILFSISTFTFRLNPYSYYTNISIGSFTISNIPDK